MSDRSTDDAALRRAALDVLEAWKSFNDPKIRVGPVWPTMRRLAEVLGEDPAPDR